MHIVTFRWRASAGCFEMVAVGETNCCYPSRLPPPLRVTGERKEKQFIKGLQRSQQLSEVRTVACSQVHLSRIATYTAFRGLGYEAEYGRKIRVCPVWGASFCAPLLFAVSQN
uniref:Uncharacterized protein n=1 Tax=Rhipicephalus zambeziensis TaxID=60191 RepID=A0A224YI06_9ACAR